MLRSRLTLELQNAIMRRVRAGVPLPVASPASGVSYHTVKGWLVRGRHADFNENGEPVDPRDKPYADFADAFDQARAAAISSRVVRINRAGRNGNVNADIWWLEKRTPMFRPRTPKRDADDPPPPGADGSRTILVYPVPMPIGADTRSYALPAGHAFDALESGDTHDTEGEEVGGEHDR